MFEIQLMSSPISWIAREAAWPSGYSGLISPLAVRNRTEPVMVGLLPLFETNHAFLGA
ncbi:hypothetical protein ACVWYQ_003222 [Bradyrhizobium sp. USDA 3397]